MTSDEALSTVGVGESSSSVDTNVSWPESPPPPVPEVLTDECFSSSNSRYFDLVHRGQEKSRSRITQPNLLYTYLRPPNSPRMRLPRAAQVGARAAEAVMPSPTPRTSLPASGLDTCNRDKIGLMSFYVSLSEEMRMVVNLNRIQQKSLNGVLAKYAAEKRFSCPHTAPEDPSRNSNRKL